MLVEHHWVLETYFYKRDCWLGGDVTFTAISYSLGGSVFLPAPGSGGGRGGCCLESGLGSNTQSEDHPFGGGQSWECLPHFLRPLGEGACKAHMETEMGRSYNMGFLTPRSQGRCREASFQGPEAMPGAGLFLTRGGPVSPAWPFIPFTLPLPLIKPGAFRSGCPRAQARESWLRIGREALLFLPSPSSSPQG